ncbi:hypothetical protein HMPREF9995_06637, partial [Staphylococcus epidermidis NIHLM095]
QTATGTQGATGDQNAEQGILNKTIKMLNKEILGKRVLILIKVVS